MWEETFDTSRFIPQDLAAYPFDVSLFKYKMCVVGDAEVGKTSLLKCFQSTPLFFKSLPTVDCTVGITNTIIPYERDGNQMQILLQDFAGQEIYHGHSAFLTGRTLYVFVWNMDNVEQSFEHYGISEKEEVRLKYWISEVQARSPGATIAIVGTHKDVLPDQSTKTIEIILQKVHRIFSEYIEHLRSSTVHDVLFICSTFSVSCKDRTCVPENRGGPTTIKEMFEFLADVCYKSALRDKIFPATRIPSSIHHVLKALSYIREKMNVILLPVHEFQRLLWQLQVVDHSQSEAMTRLLHDWGVVYVFDRQAARLTNLDCVFLQPAQLSVMCAALFSYAHACLAPSHERALLKGLTIDVAKCDAADPGRLILRGFLIQYVAREIFNTPLRAMRRDPLSNINLDICLKMLQDMDIAWRFDPSSPTLGTNTLIKEEYCRIPQPMYVVPSLLPLAPPRLISDFRALLVNRLGARRVFLLTPFPVEFFSALGCRISHMVVPLGLACHRRDLLWIGGGGGADNAALGLGPLRGVVRHMKKENAIEVDTVQPQTAGGMTAQGLMEAFTACLKELVDKCKGVTCEVMAPCPECGVRYNVDTLLGKDRPPPRTEVGPQSAPEALAHRCSACSPAAQYVAGKLERTKETKKAIHATLWGPRKDTVSLSPETKRTLEECGFSVTEPHVTNVLGFTTQTSGGTEMRLSGLLDDLARHHFGIK